jgi:ATP-dependent DNA helicase PIF1
MVTNNVCIPKGIHNGALGTVHAIIYDPDESRVGGLPLAVIVQMDKYNGRSIMPNVPKCVPITPITASWNSSSGSYHYRRELPLRLAWAMTIHKSQGQTLPKAVINLGDRETSLGLTLVATSRVKRMEDLVISPMAFSRLEKVNNKKELPLLLQEMQRLQNKSQSA